MICSIIIRSYNEERHIGRLIIGIQKQRIYNSSAIEIILVDSGSTDSTVSIAKKLGAKVIEIPKEEFSFGRALNIGCASALGSILLFVSAHVYPVYNDWLEIILNCFDDKNVGLVYGRQIGNEITKFSEHQVFRKWFPSISNYNQDHPFCSIDSSGALWLVENSFQLIGIDYLSIQRFNDGPEIHTILLDSGMVIVETLNLKYVNQGLYELICLPLNLDGLEGSPARVLLKKI